MQHIQRLEDCQLAQDSVVTIGVFDGVHRGHQALVQELVQVARQAQQRAVVMTFFPHPDIVLRGLSGRYYLTSPTQRAHLLGELGVDVVVTHPFNDDVRNIRAADFVQKLVKHLQMKALWVGEDFALGYQREGTVDYLTQLGTERGYTVKPLTLVAEGDDAITSTAIRSHLMAGDIATANNLLGRMYHIQGEVVKGDQRGRAIGFPTANMAVWDQQILPQHGVYAGWATLGDERFMAVANIGVRPTFKGQTMTVEPHLLDFDRDIYGEMLSFQFAKRLRGEQKFDGFSALKAQLTRDIEAGRAYLDSQT